MGRLDSDRRLSATSCRWWQSMITLPIPCHGVCLLCGPSVTLWVLCLACITEYDCSADPTSRSMIILPSPCQSMIDDTLLWGMITSPIQYDRPSNPVSRNVITQPIPCKSMITLLAPYHGVWLLRLVCVTKYDYSAGQLSRVWFTLPRPCHVVWLLRLVCLTKYDYSAGQLSRVWFTLPRPRRVVWLLRLACLTKYDYSAGPSSRVWLQWFVTPYDYHSCFVSRSTLTVPILRHRVCFLCLVCAVRY
jgi:hypothetical protein